MKKIAALAMAMLMVTCLFAGCAKKEAANDDLSYVKDKGTLVIGITEYAPMNYYDDSGKLIGFDTEFAETVCEKLGVAPEFTVIDWNTKEVELKAKNIDCIWNGFTIREDLKESIDFSNAYCKNMQVAVIKAENSGKYTDLASLAKANIVAEAGSSGESAVADCEELKECNYVGVSKMADALLEVKAGTADAAVVDYVMAKAMVGEGTDYSDLQIVDGIELAYEEYGIGFRKDSNLVESVNKAMDEMIADGSLKAIADKYGLALMAD